MYHCCNRSVMWRSEPCQSTLLRWMFHLICELYATFSNFPSCFHAGFYSGSRLLLAVAKLECCAMFLATITYSSSSYQKHFTSFVEQRFANVKERTRLHITLRSAASVRTSVTCARSSGDVVVIAFTHPFIGRAFRLSRFLIARCGCSFPDVGCLFQNFETSWLQSRKSLSRVL